MEITFLFKKIYILNNYKNKNYYISKFYNGL